ncbi:GAF domain-containing protein [Hymenobacter latericus]|uniref:GAF domain-containing protein n=1 Tax=Hymenobacter sp. YIM 151858-1 TaxID=2987688 RepID=UPI002227E0FB|nr:GAF domain-containing protein [Hymenobacter sp. YIM 151858-1]UYZ60485.1 GAF domain-containing protein [Hymenobacter sp. YIM 151858-1]
MAYVQPDSLIPDNELDRLRTLYHYQILNTTYEKVFDDFVALTAQLFNLPISLLSLIDEEEVYFKANSGMDGLPATLPRADSLCSAAVLEEATLVFPDLTQERCNLVNPAVAESAGLRSYAGAPLRMPNGHNIGTLCVIGREPRAFTAGEEELLMHLAKLVSLTIEVRSVLLQQELAEQWQQTQAQLQTQLLDASTLARYLAARTNGAAYFSEDVQQTVVRRLDDIAQVLRRQLAEVHRLASKA